jgi:hypothetical protein
MLSHSRLMLSKSAVVRYRSAPLGSSTTISFPAFPGSFASCSHKDTYKRQKKEKKGGCHKREIAGQDRHTQFNCAHEARAHLESSSEGSTRRDTNKKPVLGVKPPSNLQCLITTHCYHSVDNSHV